MTTAEKVRDRLSVGGLDACWDWQGATTDAGYGTVDDSGRTRLVHRFMWEKFHGSIPSDRQIDHLCRNRRCGNPHHMELVTSRENTLRGTGPTALNAQATHCKNGHEFTAENTYEPPHRPGRRECRICKRELSKNWMRARRALEPRVKA